MHESRAFSECAGLLSYSVGNRLLMRGDIIVKEGARFVISHFSQESENGRYVCMARNEAYTDNLVPFEIPLLFLPEYQVLEVSRIRDRAGGRPIIQEGA
jgi:hypothetical protein